MICTLENPNKIYFDVVVVVAVVVVEVVLEVFTDKTTHF